MLDTREGLEQSKTVIGSKPPECVNKCKSCRPCMATLVVPNHQKRKKGFKVSSRGDDDTYYLLSWKCKCAHDANEAQYLIHWVGYEPNKPAYKSAILNPGYGSVILVKLEMKCLQMTLLSVTTANSLKLFLLRTRNPSHAFSFSPHRQFQPLSFPSAVLRRLPPCRAASPGPPLPPSDNDSRHLKAADVGASLSKIQDRIQIFFAVLFWLSLFFWASAWDGRNRPNKGSRFRR
ncbi:unnamed protein product [Sphenostylis stenocarpa]|uniref:Uncharacterized protein n=1 Tax=Sphenostylis stenocarpa TaxID=92480 RepID=A0AA86SV33_9FABA|nr:unnamed protein product [Sphenostylis stenocarpa]